MTRGVFRYFVAPLVCVGLLSGCRFDMFDRREPWRAEAEEQCIAEKGVTVSAYVEPVSAINGAGSCGMEHPFRVTALDEGLVAVQPRATLACPMIRNLNVWLEQVVQPAAIAWMGQPVAGIKQMSSYSCRGMNGDPSAKISEHAFGNALDVGAFIMADGRVVTVKDNWKGPQETRGFLLQVQAGACDLFTTILAPGSNVFHYDHIHVDLMRHASGRVICKPAPKPMAPPVLMARQPGPVMTAPMSAPMVAPPSGPPPLSRPEPMPQQQPANVPAGEPLDIMPHPPEHSGQEYQRGYPPPQVQQPQMPAPPYAQNPNYGPAPSYGAPQRPYPAQVDPHQPVLMPPGAVPKPNVLRPPGPMSYAPGAAAGSANVGPFETGAIAGRKYYSVPIPQASTIPLPTAVPGED